MKLTLGDAYNPVAVQPMCGCTRHSGHDDVRRLIKAKELKTIPAVMQELEWTTSCGCAKCRPALNYYLVCDWPGEYADDFRRASLTNACTQEQKRIGASSVVPRMWGGVTSAKELRAIADVVDKFQIPTVKVTGGQRASTCSACARRTCRRSGRILERRVLSRAMPTRRGCAP